MPMMEPRNRVVRVSCFGDPEGLEVVELPLPSAGLLCAIGFSASVQAQRRMLPILMEIARLYLWRLLPGGKRARFTR
jgi:hypothetical protein